jgi:hypothetical protein
MSIDQSGDSSRDTREVGRSAPIPGPTLDPESRQPSPARIAVQEMLEMFAHSGPMPDPLLDKLDGQHLAKILEIAEKRAQNDFELQKSWHSNQLAFNRSILRFLSFVLLAVLGMVWMFLHFGKTEQVFNLISMLFVGGGGVGIGTALNSRRFRTPPPGPSSGSSPDTSPPV